MKTTSLLSLAALCTLLVSCRVADPTPGFQIVAGTYACPTCDNMGVTGLTLEQTQSTGTERDVYVVYQRPGEPRQYVYGESFTVQPQGTRDTADLYRMADSLVTASVDKPNSALYKHATVSQLVRSGSALGTLVLQDVQHYPEQEFAPTTLAVAMRNIEAVVPASTLPRATKTNTGLVIGVVFFASIIIGLLVYMVVHATDPWRNFKWRFDPPEHF